MKKEKILRAIFVILLALAIRIYIEIAPSLRDKTNPRLSQSVQIVELDICGIHYSEEGIPETVEVCGAIEIKDDATVAYLDILVFWMPEKIPVSMLDSVRNHLV